MQIKMKLIQKCSPSILIGISFAVASIALTGCTYTFKKSEEVAAVPVNTIKPEIDYSNEAPGCVLAAQRIKEHVVVGMTLGDVRRLVGQPRLIVPGSWQWTDSFPGAGKSTRPVVKYGFKPSADDVPITSFGFNSEGC